MRKRVFIGSSVEARPELERVVGWLADADVTPLPWNSPGLFPLGSYVLARLIEIATEVNGAVLLFTPDDRTWYRKGVVLQPRDNVILEYGLFASRLGERGAVICCKEDPKIATDLVGLTRLNISQQGRARAELVKWARELPGSSAPRLSLLGSTTEEIKASEKLTAALKDFYRQFIEDCIRYDLGINSCGSEPFLSVAYQFYYEKSLRAGQNREWVEHHMDRIRWYWHPGGQGGVSFCPPVFESRKTAGVEERTRGEVEDSDLIVAVAGRTGTVRQLERILKDKDPSANRKRVVVVGWFGGLVHDFLAKRLSQNPRVIRSHGGLNFADARNDWHENPKALAAELVKALHSLIMEETK
jgi:hypothetical protein